MFPKYENFSVSISGDMIFAPGNSKALPDLENFAKILVFFNKGSDHGRYYDRDVSKVS